MPTICLIRHGESAANAGMPTSNPAQIPLTVQGHRQAAALARVFRRAPARIICSPYLRTRQTAAPLTRRFPAVPCEEWPVQEFTYLAPARCANMTGADRRPLVAAFWERNDPAYCDGPGAESFAELIGRTRQTLARLAAPEGGLVALFSHGQFIRAVLWLALTAPAAITAAQMRQFRAFQTAVPLPNATLVHLRWRAGQPTWISPVHMAHLPPALRTGE